MGEKRGKNGGKTGEKGGKKKETQQETGNKKKKSSASGVHLKAYVDEGVAMSSRYRALKTCRNPLDLSSVQVKKLHNWKLTPAEAVQLQKKLASKIRFIHIKREPKLVAGLDCAFTKDGSKIVACAVVMTMPDFKVIEIKTAKQKIAFPYVPGLLSFRESPACIAAVEKLNSSPDLFIVDGQGFAHPRRFGIASHLGLFFDKPTIGCAKSRLIGDYEDPPPQKGAYSLLKDKGETIGAVVRTRTNVKSVFVSVGNNCTLEDAIKFTLACCTKYRIPEPSRLAHQLVTKAKLHA
jgi:deoxyribonuclease V